MYENIDDDVFVPINGFPKYLVNKNGQVKHKNRKKPLNLANHNGYKKIALYTNNTLIRKNVGVHNLVYKTFGGVRPSDTHTADHIDGKRGNNHISNLRWATKSEQNANSIHPKYNKNCKRVVQLSLKKIEMQVFESTHDAADALSCNSEKIRSACRRVIIFMVFTGNMLLKKICQMSNGNQ